MGKRRARVRGDGTKSPAATLARVGVHSAPTRVDAARELARHSPGLSRGVYPCHPIGIRLLPRRLATREHVPSDPPRVVLGTDSMFNQDWRVSSFDGQ